MMGCAQGYTTEQNDLSDYKAGVLHHQASASHSVAPGQDHSHYRKLVRKANMRPHLRPTELETGVGPSSPCYPRHPGDSDAKV